MAATVDTVVRDIKSGKFQPIYLLEGDEPYYIDLITDLIPKHALGEGEKEFNLTVVYGRDVDTAAVLGHARRFPMMAERQVVIVKEAQAITDIGRDTGKEQMQKYGENPVPSTVLVICYKNKSLDKRLSWVKAMQKGGVLLSSKKIYENKVPSWINDYVAAKGGKISPKANLLLTEYIGANLERLSNELDKIFVNLGDSGEEITDSTIQEFVGINKEYNIFELQKALLFKDREKVFRIGNYLTDNQKSNPPVLMMYQLYSMFSKLLLATEYQGNDPRGLASELKMNPYFVNDYVAGLNNYSWQQIISAFSHLHEADARIKGVKSGSMDVPSIFSELLYKLLK